MGKLAYTTPVMSEEVFEADEYVAACWGVACAYGQKGYDMQDTQTTDTGVTHGMHDGRGCGYKDNQYIVVDDAGNVSMTEVRTNGLGNLACNITDENWNSTSLNQNNLNSSSVIYWTTSSGNRTWHHMGYVDMEDANRSNHS